MLAQYSPTIADLVMRIVEVGIEGLYARFSDTWRVSGDLDLDFEAPAPTYKAPNREVVPSILVPLPPDTPSTSFTFFCPDWAEGMERWTSIEEIRSKGMRWLSLVRGLGGRRVETMVKICRIGAVYLEGLQKDKAAALGLSGTERTRSQNKELLVSVHVSSAVLPADHLSQPKPKCSPGSSSFVYLSSPVCPPPPSPPLHPVRLR